MKRFLGYVLFIGNLVCLGWVEGIIPKVFCGIVALGLYALNEVAYEEVADLLRATTGEREGAT